MRQSPLRQLLQQKGAEFVERYGVEVPKTFGEHKAEYGFVRDGAAVSDFSFMQAYRIPEETGVDFLDNALAGNVAKLRFGRVLHTFLADDNGELVADCYVANNDEELVMLCESIVDDETLDKALADCGASEAGLEKLNDSHVVLSVDGYRAWEMMRDLFGADVLGLPYLSIEMYPFDGCDIRMVRAGKTSEFGYLLVAPVDKAEALFATLHDKAVALGGGLCGVAMHDNLRLEGRFFNIYAEGEAVRDPLPLGLQWMIDFDKDAFRGRDAILQRRSQGLARKMVGVAAEAGDVSLSPGDAVYDEGAEVGALVAACRSYVLERSLGLALLPVDIAYTGLPFTVKEPNGAAIQTVSMPPIMPKSLSVKLDEM